MLDEDKRQLSKYMKSKQIVSAWFNVIASIEECLKCYDDRGRLIGKPCIKVDKAHYVLCGEDLVKAIYKTDQMVGTMVKDLPEVLPESALYEAIKEIEWQLLKVVASTQAGNANGSKVVNARNSTEAKFHKLLQYKETIVNSIELFVCCFNGLDERERVVLICKYVDKKRDADIIYDGLDSIRTITRIREVATIKLVNEIALESYMQGSFFV